MPRERWCASRWSLTRVSSSRPEAGAAPTWLLPLAVPLGFTHGGLVSRSPTSRPDLFLPRFQLVCTHGSLVLRRPTPEPRSPTGLVVILGFTHRPSMLGGPTSELCRLRRRHERPRGVHDRRRQNHEEAACRRRHRYRPSDIAACPRATRRAQAPAVVADEGPRHADVDDRRRRDPLHLPVAQQGVHACREIELRGIEHAHVEVSAPSRKDRGGRSGHPVCLRAQWRCRAWPR